MTKVEKSLSIISGSKVQTATIKSTYAYMLKICYTNVPIMLLCYIITIRMV